MRRFVICLFNLPNQKWIRLKNRNCERMKQQKYEYTEKCFNEISFSKRCFIYIYTYNSIKMIGYARIQHQHKDFVISTNPRHFVEILKEVE